MSNVTISTIKLELTPSQVTDIAALIDISQKGMLREDEKRFEVIKVKCYKALFERIKLLNKLSLKLEKASKSTEIKNIPKLKISS